MLTTAIAAVAFTAGGASSALASTIVGTAANPVFVGAPGETNTLAVSQTGADVTFNDSNPITAAPAGCTTVAGDVTCPSVSFVNISLGDGDDSTTFTTVAVPVSQNGDAGNDLLGATQGGGFSFFSSLNSNGGPGNDDLSANPEFSSLTGGPGDDILRGNAATGSFTNMISDGVADGADQFIGAAGQESVSYDLRTNALTVTLDGVANDGEAGEGDNLVGAIDSIDGGAGNDSITGAAGDESLSGGGGNDTLNGLAGADFLGGDNGDDTLNGGDGDDTLFGGAGADAYNGGTGIDRAFISSNSTVTPFGPLDQSATLDGVANDGSSGEGDNVGSDMEDIDTADGNDTLIGNAAFNILNGNDGNDTIDGGAGNDLLFGGAGNDILRARDGFADRVDCGPGADSAEVDTLDDVSASCEVVTRVDVGNANDIPEDAPPTVAFASPTANQAVSPDKPVAVSLNAADDHGVTQVVLIANGTVVGSDSTAPYAISYQPVGADVGRATLVAVAVDGRGQTGNAVQSVRVARFTPRRVTAIVTPTRDRSAPYRFRTRGTVSRPAQVTRAQGCGTGQVNVQVKRGSTTVSSRRVTLRKDCTYQSTVTFTNRRRLGRTGRLNIRVRFLGNTTLATRAAPTRKVRAG